MVKIARDIYCTKAFATLGLEELSPCLALSTDPRLRDWGSGFEVFSDRAGLGLYM